MSTPSRKVANMAPARVLMWVSAQRPKAAEPPARLMSATMAPRMTRKSMMPALSATAGVSPSFTMASSAPSGLKLEKNSAPSKMPTNSDE